VKCGIFRKVEIEDGLAVDKNLSTYYFLLSRLDGRKKELVLEVILSKGDDPDRYHEDNLHVEFGKNILPFSLLEEIEIARSLYGLIKSLAHDSKQKEVILRALKEVVPDEELHDNKLSCRADIALNCDNNDKEINFILDQIVDQFEDLLTLQIGIDSIKTNRIYFSIQHKAQPFPLFEKTLPEKKTRDFIRIKEN